jgi:hypothetical protein
MRYLVVLLILLLGSCADSFYEKEYYERISSIRIPATAKVLESVDNGEYYTGTTFRLSEDGLHEFLKKNQFMPCGKRVELLFCSNALLKGYKPDLDNAVGLLFTTGVKGKNNWLYIVDTTKRLLWAEIQYPDWGGD